MRGEVSVLDVLRKILGSGRERLIGLGDDVEEGVLGWERSMKISYVEGWD
jgi:hypothetical protein